ncbi:MAG TPA: cupredoxin domain-containing protein [Dehalococcoidia bacterium]|nr:cupredoxin domain-containing protein [Dehalococcoidia bacterium]
MRRALRAIVPCLALVLLVSACSSSALASHATVRIHYTHYEPDVLTVHAGEPLTLTLQNDDPIAHEWIVGTEEVHQRHRTGTDTFHDLPTEVSIPALSTRVTTVVFDTPGEYKYICHLPGHEAYGMVGTLRVVR